MTVYREAQSVPVTLLQQRIDATNRKDWAAWEALHHVDAVRTGPELTEPMVGRRLLRAAIEALAEAFPDYHLSLVDVLTDGDRIAARIHTTGTMTGPLMLSSGLSVPASGRTIDQEWMAQMTVANGLIAEFREYYDQLQLLEQLGLLHIFATLPSDLSRI
ncbi:ester cyclase [Actinoplanes sp. CA-030573]|uniref:ester cyclase n=1 Tax=Actinoplanes sp. CA-030573 TaxID=3239898 RepID=UPI003D8E2E7C